VDVMLCRAAILEMSLPQNWHAEVLRGAQSTFPITAADLMPALQGPDLGVRLKAMQAIWLRSDLTMTKAALLQAPTNEG
jgi:poly(A) polymerase